jgi:3-methyl-2-oxobutanoate hydroxymethyltransferase
MEKKTVLEIRRRKGDAKKISALTAYDYTFAGLADNAGIDIILVGDSLANTMLGLESTVPVTLEQMIHHTLAVSRAVKSSLVVADMPFGTVQQSPEQAINNAVRVLKEAGADAVKIEGNRTLAPTIERVASAGIPVVGHVGLMPQFRSILGGLKVQGREQEAARQILQDALAMEKAGAFAIVLEAVPRELAAKVTEKLTIPTIGIGAGPDCDGQILVIHDILGLSEHAPKFSGKWADLGAEIDKALNAYRRDVESGSFPADKQSFHVDKKLIEDI